MTAFPRIGLRRLLMVLTLAGIAPLTIVATLLLVTLWRSRERLLGLLTN